MLLSLLIFRSLPDPSAEAPLLTWALDYTLHSRKAWTSLMEEAGHHRACTKANVSAYLSAQASSNDTFLGLE